LRRLFLLRLRTFFELIPRSVAATCAAGCASRSPPARRHRTTPAAVADVPIAREVKVIDPVHPLYGRRFQVVSVIRESCANPMVRVEWRFGLTLLLPLSVTDLRAPEELRKIRIRLGVEALEDLVAVAEATEGACLSSLETSGARCRQLSAGRSSPTLRQCSGE
jgi:hypothetical protein